MPIFLFLHRYLWPIALAAVLFWSISIRIETVSTKTTLNHDEAISYLISSGNAAKYKYDKELSHKWVAAAKLKKYLVPTESWYSLQIAKDVAMLDRNPPLYYWLLNNWLIFNGAHVKSGVELNIILGIVNSILLFLLGLIILGRADLATAAVTLWSLNPNVLGWTQARCYELKTTSMILLAIVFLKLIKAKSNLLLFLALTLVALFGQLTHYLFFLPLVGLVIWTLMNTKYIKAVETAKVIGAMALSAAGFILIHPLWHLSFAKHQRLLHHYNPEALDQRMASLKVAILRTFGAPLGVSLTTQWLMIATIFASTILISRQCFMKSSSHRFEIRTMLFLYLWVGGLTSLLFITFQTPQHVMNARYIAPMIPLMAVSVTSLVAEFSPKFALILILAFSFGVLVPRSLQEIQQRQSYDHIPDRIGSARRIVIDSKRRGVVLQLMSAAPATANVFIAKTAQLIENPDPWLSRLESGSVVVVTDTSRIDEFLELMQHMSIKLESYARGKIILVE